MRVKILIISLLVVATRFGCFGQNAFEISMHFYKDETKSSSLVPSFVLTTDTLQIEKVVNQQLYSLYEMGYLSATSNKIFMSNNKVNVDFIAGAVFEISRLSQGNVSDEVLNKIGFDTRNFGDKPFSHQKLVRLLNSILDYAENHGYPFASVKLDSIEIVNQEISGWINYSSGPEIVFDSLVIAGYEKVKTKYLMTHLGIYKGNPYEEKLIEEISNKMKLLPFINLSEPPGISISKGKCTIHLTTSQNRVSKLDGILGILPNQKEGESVLITGQLNLDLHNLFSSGKRIALEWQSFDSNSQLLDVLYYHPNLFRTPLNIQGDFYLLKQDTTFINREFAIEFSLLSKNSSKIGFKTELISSRLISTYGIEDVTDLPDNTDYNLNYYGLNYNYFRFDNLNLPTRGWGFIFNGSVGQKKLIRNPVYDESIYSGIDLQTIQLKIFGEVDKYWPLVKNLLFRSRIHGGYLNGSNLFQSDLFRVGGLRTLRGFVENQFFTSAYGIANLELRAMFSNETYFMIFYDQAALTEDFEMSQHIQYPFGAGAGFSFTTNAGIFNFVLALGKSNLQPFGLEYSKIHFGYISRF